MMRTTFFALLLLASACANNPPTPTATPTQGEKTAAPSDSMPAEGNASGVYGEKFEVKDKVSIAALDKSLDSYVGKPIQLEGQITAVCQQMGCWLEIGDATSSTKVRVVAKDHSFTVPKDSTGKTAIASGILTSKTLDEKEAAHLAEDAGKPAPTTPQKELRIEATGVLFSQK